MTESRDVVLWIASNVPQDILDTFAIAGSLEVRTEATINRESLRSARLVIVPFASATTVGINDLRAAIDAGCDLILLIRGDASRADASRFGAQIATGVEVVDILDPLSAREILRHALKIEPRLAENPSIEMPIELDAEAMVLLRRAFSDFKQVEILEEHGGFSGSRVLRITATNSDGKLAQPFLVKCGDRKEIEDEVKNTREFVLDYVPFPNRPPLVSIRCVAGSSKALIVSAFVERAVRLDLFLKTGLPEIVIAALFDGPLRNWRRQAERRRVHLSKYYQEQGIVPTEPKVLERRFEKLKVGVPVGSLDPAALLDAFAAIEAVDTLICRSHGDLNVRNIFVKRTAVDVILIDFEKTTEAHAARDAATLDVSLGFSFMETPIDEPVLDRLYAPHVLQNKDYPRADERSEASSRIEAIRQLRLQAASECLTRREYDLAIAVQLVQAFWKWQEVGPERLVIAYRLASNLVQSLRDESKQT